jgi:hypothetical protein
MDRDGTRQGFDIPLTRAIADSVGVPVIASGGVGHLDHLVAGIRDGHASAVLAASIFHFGDFRSVRPRTTWREPACRCGSIREACGIPWHTAHEMRPVNERSAIGRQVLPAPAPAKPSKMIKTVP